MTELFHHGILGQKWGVRRYQNKDGSLTDEGRKRYTKFYAETHVEGPVEHDFKYQKKNGKFTKEGREKYIELLKEAHAPETMIDYLHACEKHRGLLRENSRLIDEEKLLRTDERVVNAKKAADLSENEMIVASRRNHDAVKKAWYTFWDDYGEMDYGLWLRKESDRLYELAQKTYTTEYLFNTSLGKASSKRWEQSEEFFNNRITDQQKALYNLVKQYDKTVVTALDHATIDAFI